MFKCRVTQFFTLKDFDKLHNIKRKSVSQHGKLYTGDTFECDEKMARYLLGNNPNGVCVIKVIEIKR